MTINITDLASGPGVVTFNVWTDSDGCDEDFEAQIGGVLHVAHLTLVGGGLHPAQSIRHNLNGLYNVVITARTSRFFSQPAALNLTGDDPTRPR
jgi:hypothetical protein